MTDAEEPTRPEVRSGCVHRFQLTPTLAAFLEILRIRHRKASAEEVLREAFYDLADANGIHVPRVAVSDADREKIAAQGVLDHGAITSVLSRRFEARKHGWGYVELVLFYDGEDKWPNRLLAQCECELPELLLRAVHAYTKKDVSP